MRLSDGSKTSDYLDRALIEYSAASFHFEQAGNERYLARVENNLGYLFFTIGRYKDSHSHLDRARHLFLKLKDVGTAAQVDDTRARALLAQGHVAEAERLVRSAVKVLERGGQQALLAEALTTQGVALARLGNHPRARALLERAIEVAETTGDLEGAGRAKLSIIEELEEKIPAKELVSIYRSAIELLKNSQDPTMGKRLIACADKLLDTKGRLEAEGLESQEHTWEGFSFKQHIHNGERAVIERALRDTGGSVTRAARLLGFRHHQSLIHLINSRHKDLLKTRSTVRKRRRHLFSPPKETKKKVIERSPRSATSQISILHVEDNKVVARLIQDTLGVEGIHVDSCLSGTTALEILRSDAPYDLVIIDNDLPGLSGLELVLRVQTMAHRRNTPVIMLSGDDCEAEAWRAGVKAFLRKPEAVNQVSSTIKRLLEQRKGRTD
jgi:CheY-like chemotaxis protein